MPRRPARSPAAPVVAVLVAGSLVVVGAEVGAAYAVRSTLDHRAYVSELRLDAALETFRPVERPGLAAPADPTTFAPEENPRTDPGACVPLSVLTTTAPEDGRSWTGADGRPAQPVTLLVVRFPDADAARTELARKRLALLRCRRVAITFPPYDAPPTTYTVEDRLGPTTLAGPVVRWSLVGGDRRFDFYVRRYANTLVWTYADDVSTPQVREEVADSLVVRLQDLARR